MDDLLPVPVAIDEIDRFIRSGDLDDALDAAELLVEREHSSATLHALGRAGFELAAATYDEELHDDALATFREAVALAPNAHVRAEILADRATRLTNSVFLTGEREQEAAADYQAAHAADPTNVTALMGLALMRAQPSLGASRAQAIVWMEEAILQAQVAGMEDWSQWSLLAHLFEEDGNTERATEAYERMLALFPFGTGHPMEFVMRQQRKHLQALRGERIMLFDLAHLPETNGQ